MQLAQMLDNGLEVISSGANVPFADQEIFYGPIAELADSKCAVIPDFISNCGMARVFGYLMQEDAVVEDEAIFEDVSNTIFNALRDVHTIDNQPNLITFKAYTNALKLLL
jgi:glutamate dehydrogenase/leucine dehydrogenase